MHTAACRRAHIPLCKLFRQHACASALSSYCRIFRQNAWTSVFFGKLHCMQKCSIDFLFHSKHSRDRFQFIAIKFRRNACHRLCSRLIGDNADDGISATWIAKTQDDSHDGVQKSRDFIRNARWVRTYFATETLCCTGASTLPKWNAAA